MLSHGFDWSSYSCEGWAEEFGTSYIMLDGGNSGGEAWSLFGDGYIPIMLSSIITEKFYTLITDRILVVSWK